MFMLLHGTHVYPKNSKVLIIVVKVKSCKLVAIDKWPVVVITIHPLSDRLWVHLAHSPPVLSF